MITYLPAWCKQAIRRASERAGVEKPSLVSNTAPSNIKL